MKISKNWLSNFISTPKSNDKLESDLTKLGLEVDTINKDKDDHIIDIEFTPNRGDCLSVYGTARDLGAYKGKKINKPACSKSITAKINTKIKNINSAISPEYKYMILNNINVNAKTPKYITTRLRQCEIAPVNIIVDISNYVMLEVGQPTHAFDLDKINGKLSIVQLKKKNIFLGLDNKEYIVDKDTEVIVDEKNIIHALPGVIGSKLSSVTSSTQNILFESAFFIPDTVRFLSRKFRIQTDSSYRFERGVDYNLTDYALSRIHFLLNEILNIGSKCIITKISKQSELTKKKQFEFDTKLFNRILGIDIGIKKIKLILMNLGIIFSGKKVIIPSHRSDISCNYDLVEEVSRIYGFDNIKEVPLENSVTKYYHHSSLNIRLVTLGYKEVINFTFIAKNYSEKPNSLELSNPISKEKSVMRESLLPGLLNNIVYNSNRQHKSIQLFERGKIYLKDRAKIKEPKVLSAVVYGNKSSLDLVSDGYIYGLGDLKSDILSIFPNVTFVRNKSSVYFDKDNSLSVLVDSKVIGECGILSSNIIRDFNLKSTVYAFELIEQDFVSDSKVVFSELSQFPSVFKDITVVTNINTNVSNIVDEIKKESYKYMKNIRIKDIFINKDNLKSNNRNVTLEVCLQSDTKTLQEKDILDDINRVMKSLTNKHKIQIQEA
jgi:phenylalanyl-tRNA synthetase beta chain